MTERIVVGCFKFSPRRWARGSMMAAMLAVVGFFVFMPSEAHAQNSELQQLLNRLERMERDIRTLNVQISRGRAPASAKGVSAADLAAGKGPALARLEVRLTALEEELRSVTGKLESESHLVNQINKRLDKLISDIDFRLSALEKASGAARGATPSKATPQQPATPVVRTAPKTTPVETAKPGSAVLGTLKKSDLTATPVGPPAVARKDQGSAAKTPKIPPQKQTTKVAPRRVLPKGSVKDQYAFAFSLLRQAKYDAAEKALKEFIAGHKKHSLASNARYWLGETYYVRRKYADAAKIFYKAYQSNKKGNKAPDSLLKLGMSLAGLKRQKEACAAFTKLTNDFPSLPPSINKKLSVERKRVGCP